jgi:hypothetical protein
MRWFAMTVAVWLAWPAAPVEACSGPCSGRRLFWLEEVTATSVPRDGAVSFQVGASVETCLAELAPAIAVEVTRDDEVIPGRVYMPGGADLLVFTPDASWSPDTQYVARVTIDNDKIAAKGDELCDNSESLLVGAVEFMSTSGFSQALPTPPPPVLTTKTLRIDDRYDAIACCPPTEPESDDSAGCNGSLGWSEAEGCVYLFEETYLLVEMPVFAVPPQLSGQVLRELVVDGAVVARGDEAFVARSVPVCASTRLTHLGTGEQSESATECPSEETAAALGVQPRDAAAEFDNCDDPVLCPNGNSWDPAACVPFDPQAFPPAPVVPAREESESECPGRDGAGIVAMGPDSGATEDSGETGGSGESGEVEETGEQGCGCTQSRGPGGALVLMGALVWRRRWT